MKTQRWATAIFSALALLAVSGSGFATEGRAWGDIHLQTMDGAMYDFQAAGEFIASRSTAGDFEVQLRLEPAGFSSNVSVATAVAALVDSTRVSVALGRESLLHVDEQPATLPDGYLELPAGGRIEGTKRGFEIYWRDGSTLTLTVRKKYIDVFLRPAATRRSALSGLFGNFNGIAADDVEANLLNGGSDTSSVLRAGLMDISRALLEDGDETRVVEQKKSLFEYEPGQSTYSFRKPAPTRQATVAALPAAQRQRARQVCEEAGVTDPDLLEACIIDVGYTRDESFAESAVAVQARDEANWDAELEAAYE